MTSKPEVFFKEDIEDRKIELPETLWLFLQSRKYHSISKKIKKM